MTVYTADLSELIGAVTADSTAWTADSTIWPTADVTHTGAQETSAASVDVIATAVETAGALDVLDAIFVAADVAVMAEAAAAADVLDATVIAAEVPVYGGGGYRRPLRLEAVVGHGYGILPPLRGEAHGVVGEVDDELELLLLLLAA